MLCMSRAKFLSKSFYRFCTAFELLEDKQRAKLGGVDASKMHLLFQAFCFIICSRVFPYLNKTAKSDAVFSKVSFVSIFLQEIKSWKNTTSICMEKEDIWQMMDMREYSRAKRGGPMQPLYLFAWAHPKWVSGTAITSCLCFKSLSYTFTFLVKTGKHLFTVVVLFAT